MKSISFSITSNSTLSGQCLTFRCREQVQSGRGKVVAGQRSVIEEAEQCWAEAGRDSRQQQELQWHKRKQRQRHAAGAAVAVALTARNPRVDLELHLVALAPAVDQAHRRPHLLTRQREPKIRNLRPTDLSKTSCESSGGHWLCTYARVAFHLHTHGVDHQSHFTRRSQQTGP